MRRHMVVALVAVGLVEVACDERRKEPVAPLEQQEVLTVREQLRAGEVTPDLELGDDCRQGGEGRCHTGRCLHSGVAPDDFYVCSKDCSSDDACPIEWTCLTDQGLGRGFCAPSAITRSPGNRHLVVPRSTRAVAAPAFAPPSQREQVSDGSAQ